MTVTNKLMNTLLICMMFVATEGAAQAPVSANGKFATINGLKIYYEESGTGMPIILLHHFFANTTQWKEYVPELAKKYRVINVDLPGHGRSDYMDTTKVYLHERAADYIIGLIDQLKLDSVYIMGASSGSFIAMYITTINPKLVKKLIIVGGQLYYSRHTRETISGFSLTPSEQNIARHGKEKAFLLQKQFYNFRQLYRDPSFTPDILESIAAKTLIIHGDNDFIAPLSNALEMHKYIPNSHLWIVPNGGHVPPSDDPKNKIDYTNRLLAFLNGDWDKK